MTTETELTNESLKKVSFHTLGCRLNFSETGSIAQGFVDRGYKVVDFGESSDVTFINTCTVTDGADSTCRNLIRKAHKASPEGKIVVAGCYAQMDAPRIAQMQGVDLVLGTTEKYKVFDYLSEEGDDVIHIDKTHEFYGAATTSAEGHTRAFLKIQDGCNYVCSFCIIPFARGRSRAISVAEAVTNAKALLERGFKEIVLTGVNIGEYEANSGEKLTDLIKELLSLEGLERLRLSSVEPNTITDELLEVFKSSPKFMDHFHIPLQSGDDEILKNMRRKYDVSYYRDVINKIITAFPNAGIGADIICGFPGETEEQFQNTFKLLKELPITHFHVFPYSKRKNTTAAKMDNHIQHGPKKERVRALNMFGEAKLNMFAEDQVGSTSEVLFERKNKAGLWEGYTTNYVRVFVDSKDDLKNQIKEVYLKEFKENKLYGEIL
ncbi:tRNA (N(6)-L-threonylcarbamoyladenosine(37)-C(2))-methylthiotransferase MtaB [Halobacteriovorax sp. GB3]|uniref:tRNA (N(6)-L-threonylcarbamoyladenosine(37)-C(2))- methylthiotransferase MtaB n=1 Tax=Halobacteriovorax sp. GB3 TaxID=2719615 RepID=UPI00235F0F8B|nr:tRNA (N(6)-L-threonylcarbamoyladenosine(37)-C(2))-methylthiotransferase MtaB [Halobacteriovorax sp. GB3]MDD0854885.1 tRNA (N(6)-L-threonylcarbamoyladenosine(37)-C(2))-methylthiotransferase MtaB [Halobacteriovorax sp. GB3]